MSCVACRGSLGELPHLLFFWLSHTVPFYAHAFLVLNSSQNACAIGNTHSEKVIGVAEVRKEVQMSLVMKTRAVQDALLRAEGDHEVFAEPTAKLAAEGKLDELLGIVSSPKDKEQ